MDSEAKEHLRLTSVTIFKCCLYFILNHKRSPFACPHIFIDIYFRALPSQTLASLLYNDGKNGLSSILDIRLSFQPFFSIPASFFLFFPLYLFHSLRADEIKLWLTPSAKQRRNRCSGLPAVYPDLSTRHDWPVRNALPVIR